MSKNKMNSQDLGEKIVKELKSINDVDETTKQGELDKTGLNEDEYKKFRKIKSQGA